MEIVIQVCSTAKEIKTRMEKLPYLSYELIGGDRDYTIVISDAREDDYCDVEDLFEDITYGGGELTLAETLVELLKDEAMTISFAESCTGGLLSSAIVDVAGSSRVLNEGLVTYSNSSKMERLNVSVDTLINHGAVSKETACEMAEGLLVNPKTTIAVSVTGIAGPEGGTNDKPVGLVYIAIAGAKRVDVYKNYFHGERNSIRNQAKNCALYYTIMYIKNNC